MLTIENLIPNINREFSWEGNEWILYGADKTIMDYTFCFIPMQAGRYDTQNVVYIKLNRYKDNDTGYAVYNPNGVCIYVQSNDMKSWIKFVELICKNKMLC